MPQLQVCAQGHHWNPLNDSRASITERWNRCPVCGGPVDLISLHDTRPSIGPDSAADSARKIPTPARIDPRAVAGYEILGEVGRGGMGVIYKAKQLSDDRIVALKMISAGSHAGTSELARFRTEVQAVSRLNHPNIVQVHEVGEQEGLPFVALEFMDRGSLSENLGGAPLPYRYAAELIEMMARAVQAAHDQGILHRDLKPGNILLATPHENGTPLPTVVRLLGVPKLTDFGLAKRMDGDGALTRTGAVMGTPNYMAPEQAAGKTRQLGPAIDIHALGALLYECLTGRPPFKGESVMETLDQVRTIDPTPPHHLVPEVPKDLVTICMKALAKDPSHRYASARDLADDLRRFLDAQAIVAKPPNPLQRAGRWIRRNAMTSVLSASILIAVLGIAVGFWLSGKGKVQPTPEVPNAPKVEHFASFVKRWGVPEGVYPLSSEQVKRRQVSYRFTKKNDRVEKVEAVDREGRPTNQHNVVPYLEGEQEESLRSQNAGRRAFAGLISTITRQECRWEYQRNEQGDLTREIAHDRVGRVVWAFDYTTKTTGYFKDDRGFPRARVGSGAAYVAFVFTQDGLTREVRYLDRNEKRRADRDGIFGRRMEHDARGFEVSVSFLGIRDQLLLHPDGYARESLRYDEQGNIVERSYLGLDGKPAQMSAGFGFTPNLMRETFKYNADGNMTEWRAHDEKPSDAPMPEPPVGVADYAMIRFGYDERGFLVSRSYFDSNEKPINWGTARTNFHKTVYTNDDRGRCVEMITVNLEGKPAGPNNYKSVRMAYDDQGNVIERRYIDLRPDSDIRRSRFRTLAPITRMRHNANGNVIEETYFDEADKPLLLDGVHRIERQYDDRGRQAEVANYDIKGKLTAELLRPAVRGLPDGEAGPMADPIPGPARRIWKRDEQGNLQEMALFGPDNKLMNMPTGLTTSGPGIPVSSVRNVPGGAARVTIKHDDRGNLLEIAYFDQGNQPVAVSGGVARIKMSYDAHGNRTELAHFGKDGKLAPGSGPVPTRRRPRTTAEYDDESRMTRYSIYSAEGKLTDGYEWRYDEAGNMIRLAFIGAEGTPVMDEAGYAWAEYSYDSQGNLTASRYYDKDEKAVQTQVIVQSPFLLSGVRTFPPDPQRSLLRGDIVISYDGKKVACARQFFELKRNEDFDREPKEMQVLRDGKMVSVRINSGPTQLRSSRLLRTRSFGAALNPDPILTPSLLGLETVAVKK